MREMGGGYPPFYGTGRAMSFLEVKDLSISFGGLRALNRVSFSVEERYLFHHRAKRCWKDDDFQLYKWPLQTGFR